MLQNKIRMLKLTKKFDKFQQQYKERFLLTKFAIYIIILSYKWGNISAYLQRDYVKLRPRFGDVLGRGFT